MRCPRCLVQVDSDKDRILRCPRCKRPWGKILTKAEVLAEAEAEVERLRASGWTQEDFARALRGTLEVPDARSMG